MTIYISHSRNSDYKKELYSPLLDSLLSKEHLLILPHELSDDSYNTKDLFQSKKCDLIIAEVSYSATGQGIELGWADMLEIPIVCLYKEGIQVSQSLQAVSNQLLSYTNTEDMIKQIEEAVKNV